MAMNNPAVSLAFDGLNLHDEYEAELERDEQQQQRELAALLQQEFDDFEYDEEDEEEDEDEDEEDEDEEDEDEVVPREDKISDLQLRQVDGQTARPNGSTDNPVFVSDERLQHPAAMESMCTETDGDDEDDEEEEEEDDDEEEEEDEEEEDGKQQQMVELNPSLSTQERLLDSRTKASHDWSVPPSSLAADHEMVPRDCTPAASDRPNLSAVAFPPGPPSTDTSEVFGPRASTGSGRQPSPAASALQSGPRGTVATPMSFLTTSGRSSARLYSNTTAATTLSSVSRPLSSAATPTMTRPALRAVRDVAVEAVPVGQRELDQLEILYQARGRRIEELQSDVLRLKEDQARELRVLRHRLSLAEGERNGARNSHQEAQRQLVATKAELERSRSEVSALQEAIEKLSTERAELGERLKCAEVTVEAMNAQLVEMNTSEALRRAKEQQNNVMASLKMKYDREVVELRESLDSTRRDLEAREDALRETRARADAAERAGREAASEHAEAVSRMMRELDDLQSRYRDALSSASVEETKRLQVEVEQATARKNITDSINQALQDEVKELKEQLSMYEAAQRLGASAPQVSSSPALHRESSPTGGVLDISCHSLLSDPVLASSTGAQTAPSPIGASTSASLKRELERCLANYRAKRQQAAQLQEQLFEARRERQELRARLDRAEAAAREQQQRLAAATAEVEELRAKTTTPSVQEVQLQKEAERLRAEKEAAEEKMEDARRRMEEVQASEERLSELNGELQRQISQIFRDFDTDKRESLERVQQTWEQHLETSKAALREELVRQFDEERRRLIGEWEAATSELNRELDRAKAEYVTLAESKAAEEAAEERRTREAVEQARAATAEEAARETEAKREQWRAELREEMEKEVQERSEAALAAARDRWTEDERASREAAIVEAEEATERRVMSSLQAEVDERLRKAREEWSEEKEAELESRLAALQEAEAEAVRRQLTEEAEQRLANCNQDWHRRLDEALLRCQAAETLRDTLTAELKNVRDELETSRREHEASLRRQQEQLNSVSVAEQEHWRGLESELRRQVEAAEAERERERQDSLRQQREREAVELELRRHVASLENALRRRTTEEEEGEERSRGREAVGVDWNERLREMKRRLESEFRARFKDYCLRRDSEVSELHDRLERERLLRVTKWQDTRSSGTQTENSLLSSSETGSCMTLSGSDSATVDRMREQFVDALSRIRGEVLAHVSMSRTRAALALQTELGRGQWRACRRLADQLRLSCHRLEAHDIGGEDFVSRPAVLQAVDLCLSVCGSAATASSSSSEINTPRSSLIFGCGSGLLTDRSFASTVSVLSRRSPSFSGGEPLKAKRRDAGVSRSYEEKENWFPSSGDVAFVETRKST